MPPLLDLGLQVNAIGSCYMKEELLALLKPTLGRFWLFVCCLSLVHN